MYYHPFVCILNMCKHKMCLQAEIWNVQTIVKSHGHGILTIDDVKIGVQIISDHKMVCNLLTKVMSCLHFKDYF